jgi:uncharacterized membrane protein YfcA
MSDPLDLTAVWLIALIAGMIQGTVGFGFVLVAAPLLSIFAAPQLVVPAIIVQTLATSVLILLHAYRHVRISRMWLLALAGMAGIPAGTLALLVLDASPLRLLIGTVVTATAVAMMFGFKKALRYELAASIPIGFASGVLGASTGLAGPPVIFFYTNQGLHPREFRANIVAHFTMLDVIILPSFIIGGLFNSHTVLFSAQLLPATLAGVVGGIILNRWVREASFHRIALVLMGIAGVMAAVSGIAGL